MKFVSQIVLVSVTLTNFAHTITDGTFFTYRLDNLIDCARFGQSTHKFARIDGYYKDGHWFIDFYERYTFENCSEMIGTRPMQRTIVYKVQNIWNFEDKQLQTTIEWLQQHFIINRQLFLPDLSVISGPSCMVHELAKGYQQMKNGFVFSVSEKEQKDAAYSDLFFDKFNQILRSCYKIKYLKLNGWHIKNMNKLVPLDLSRVRSGIIIYVSKSSSHLINRDDIKKNLKRPDDFRYIFDTQDVEDLYIEPAFNSGCLLRKEFSLILTAMIISHIKFLFK